MLLASKLIEQQLNELNEMFVSPLKSLNLVGGHNTDKQPLFETDCQSQ